MMLKRIFGVLFTFAMTQTLIAGDATNLSGEWKVIDDKSGFTLVKVKITEPQPHLYQGHIIEAFNPPNQPVRDLSKLTIGEVVDPAINQRYQVNGKLTKRGHMMILRSPSDSDKASRKLSWVRIR